MLEFKNVSYIYGKNTPFVKTAIDNISLSFPDNAVTGLIGHTGSGKSTIAQLANALIKPTFGQILLNGKDINAKEYDTPSVRFKVGLVFQYPEYQLFEETVFKDICYGLKKMGIEKAKMHKMAYDAALMVGLSDDEVNSSPFELSGGQKRRAAMAGVLAMQPGILVLDEPASGLDPRGRQEMFAIIKKLRDSGTTIILVSHNMDEAAVNCDRICLIDHGKIKAVGTPEELFIKERAEELGIQRPRISRFSGLLQEKLRKEFPGIVFEGMNFSPEKEAQSVVRSVCRAGGADVQ